MGMRCPLGSLQTTVYFYSAFVIIVFALLLPSASHAQSSPQHPIFVDYACDFPEYSHHLFLFNNILTRPGRYQIDLTLP